MDRYLLVITLVIAASPLIPASPQKKKIASDNSAHASADSKDEQEIRQVLSEFSEAWERGDGATIDRLTSEDWYIIFPAGTINYKAKETSLDILKTGSVKFLTFKFDEIVIRIYGDTAVVNFRLTEKRLRQGKEDGGQYRNMQVWVRRQGKWQLVATQRSNIAQN